MGNRTHPFNVLTLFVLTDEANLVQHSATSRGAKSHEIPHGQNSRQRLYKWNIMEKKN